MRYSSEPLLAIIKTLDKKLLPAIWCSFNCWCFPSDVKEISDFKPLSWDNMSQDDKHKFIQPISDYIKSVIEPKEISREWNKERMNHKEFEEWWHNAYGKTNTLLLNSPQYLQIRKMFARVKYFKK